MIMRFTILCLSVLIFARPAQAKILDIQEITSAGGIKAWLVEDHSVPVIAIEFGFEGAGAAQDTPKKQGLARLASNTMDEGAGELTSQEFQNALNNNSITLRFGAGRDDFTGSLKTLSRHKDKAFDLLRLALNNPRFDDEPVNRMRLANQSRIRSSLSNPKWIAARLINDKAFEGHPYALNSGGTLSTLEGITRDDLIAFQKNRLAKNNLKIAVSGDITADELASSLDTIFGTLPNEVTELEAVAPLSIQNKNNLYLYPKDIPQSIIEIIQPGIAIDDPAYHHAQIMNFVLGASGFGSRLLEEIREKRGLTYSVHSSIYNLEEFDGLTISTSTKNENAGELLQTAKNVFTKMLSDGITDKELEDAKTYLIGSLPLFLTSTDRIARFLLNLQMDDRDLNYLQTREQIIRNATQADIQNVTNTLLNPEEWLTVIVGKPENIEGLTLIEDLPNVE